MTLIVLMDLNFSIINRRLRKMLKWRNNFKIAILLLKLILGSKAVFVHTL